MYKSVAGAAVAGAVAVLTGGDAVAGSLYYASFLRSSNSASAASWLDVRSARVLNWGHWQKATTKEAAVRPAAGNIASKAAAAAGVHGRRQRWEAGHALQDRAMYLAPTGSVRAVW